jgi:NAD(P)-dependent dehydrogenase (short-subunit alcohol dehydrogenase family)
MGGSYTKPREIATVHFPRYEARIPSLEGKVIAITGCTSGTGFIAARTVLRKGGHLIMLNRKSSRSEAAEKALAAEVPSAASEGRIVQIECDMQDFASVRAASQSINKQFADKGLDVLINNAGVMALADTATKDGYDVQMQTNHLSHFLLTKELFPLLRKASDLRGEARIANHSSLARNGGKLEAKYFGPNGGNLGGNGTSMLCGGARWVRYHQTKLANVVFTNALNDKLQAAGLDKIKVVCAAPGLAATNLQVTTASEGAFSDSWIMRFGQSAEDGTLPLLGCAFGFGEGTNGESPLVAQSGDFMEPEGWGGRGNPVIQKKMKKECTDAESRRMLWTESEKACGEFIVAH